MRETVNDCKTIEALLDWWERTKRVCDTPEIYVPDMIRRAVELASQPAAGEGWRPIESAPTDGTVIDAVARYPHATAGFPMYIHCLDGVWYQVSRVPGIPVIPWAWRPRTGWPDESHPPLADTPPANAGGGEADPTEKLADLISKEYGKGPHRDWYWLVGTLKDWMPARPATGEQGEGS